MGLVGLAVLAAMPALAQRFELPTAGCPMAHCDPAQSDQVRAPIPRVAERVARDPLPVGGGGLGCVSNGTTVACSFRGDPQRQSNLVVYDADGTRLWEDGGLLGWQAWFSAPIIGTDGSVVAADNAIVLRARPSTGELLWVSQKPDPGTPISPVVVGGKTPLLLIATKDNRDGGEPAMSTWDLDTGALLAQMPLRDPTTGALYITRNTPAVRGSRAYVLASRIDDDTDGRLVAVDVCTQRRCGPRGSMSIRWSYAFEGPSGASPLLIDRTLFFDGRPRASGGSLIALRDLGARARRTWMREFPSTFGVSPAQDPRGGVWVHYVAPDGLTLMRLAEASGELLQEIDVSGVLGVEPGYVAHSVTMMAQTDEGTPVVLLGAQPSGSSQAPTYLAAVDVASSAGGRLLWKHQVGADKADNAAGGQFPVVTNAAGKRRILFQGSKNSMLVVGEP